MADAIRKESGNRLYLAGTTSGKFQLPNNVTEDLQEACKKAGIPIITPHELRHTFISLLENEMEAPAAVVAALAGKKDNRVTSGYSHTHQIQMKKWLSAHFNAFRKALEKLKSESQTASQEVISQVQNRFKLTLWCAGKEFVYLLASRFG